MTWDLRVARIERDRGWTPGRFFRLDVDQQERLLALEVVEGR